VLDSPVSRFPVEAPLGSLDSSEIGKDGQQKATYPNEQLVTHHLPPDA
jgi:hypothetical protein